MADEKVAVERAARPPKVQEVDNAPAYKLAKHAQDADEALKAFEGTDGEVLVLDAATEKRLLRKIDMMLMPVRSINSYLAKMQMLTTSIDNVYCIWPQLLRQYARGQEKNPQ